MRSSLHLVAIAIVFVGAACGDDDRPQAAMDGTATPPPPASATTVTQAVTRTDIVSDLAGGLSLDPSLVNAWGLAFNPAGLAWVASTERGLSAVYDVGGRQALPSVVMPVAACAEGASPTGAIYNGDDGAFMGDDFIFVTEEGTVVGWRPENGASAVLRAGTSACSAVYKGATIARGRDGRLALFAANFRDGTIDVFDASYVQENAAGRFIDPNLPAGYGPFNVKEALGRLIVTYAKQDAGKTDEVQGIGNGFVDLYEIDGRFVSRLVSGGELDAPWGVALTPATFGQIPNRLLVGNFGDGRIHVYALDPNVGLATVRHEGILGGPNGAPLVIDGLWALEFGTYAGGFRADTLYFTAGPNDETHGVFGRLEAAGTVPTTPPLPPLTR